MSNQDDAVTFLKNACNSPIPKELEMQLKSGSMKISLQSKPKTHSSLPGFIMKKIPGPAIEPPQSCNARSGPGKDIQNCDFEI